MSIIPQPTKIINGIFVVLFKKAKNHTKKFIMNFG